MPTSRIRVNTSVKSSAQYFEYDFIVLIEKLHPEDGSKKKIDVLLSEVGLEYKYRQKHKRKDMFLITDPKLFMVARLKYGI